MNLAVFLDRDGTLNEDPGYLRDTNLVKLFDGVGETLSLLKNNFNFKLIVVSNQSGIARGLISDEDVNAVNDKINELLKEFNVQIDKFYYCPYHPDFNSKEECNCRKPSPQMILQAANDFQIDLSKSYLIGDTSADIEAGINAGCKTILILTGYGKEYFSILQKENKLPNFVANNFNEAGEFIIKDLAGDL